MNALNKLDRSSKLLVLISVMGIIASLLGFWILSRQGSMGTGGEVLAQVTLFENDTRVKRSSDIHWNPINATLDCYENDRIFTGPESNATIHFEGGGDIKLFPNSLVFITKGMIELESGTIEIDISKGGKALEVKSFGEQFTAKANSHLKVIQSDTVKKIIPMNDTAKKSMPTSAAVKDYVAPMPTAAAEKAPPFEIVLSSKSLDFTTNSSYQADIETNAPCDEFQYIVKKGNEVIQDVTSREPMHTLSGLDDGKYTITVIGKIKGKSVGESSSPFEVNSTKLEAPKIVTKKQKLFVKLLKSFMNVLVPTSYADEVVSGATLNWEGDAQTEYELEVSKEKQENIIQKTTVKGIQYNLTISDPGAYFWRVRSKRGKSTSLWSDYGEIEVQDKVQLIQKALMTSPAPHAKIPFGAGIIEFTWEEPYPDFNYKLEIFSDHDGSPIHTVDVKDGKEVQEVEKKAASYWWRVLAISKHGKTSLVGLKQKFTIVLPAPPKPVPVPKVLPVAAPVAAVAVKKEVPKPEVKLPEKVEPKKPDVDYIELKARDDDRGSEW